MRTGISNSPFLIPHPLSLIRHPSSLIRLACLALAVSTACVVPCRAWDPDNPFPWSSSDKDEKATPERVVALWTDAVMSAPGRPPIRGFGGRLMFFAHKKDKPIKVRGKLMIYAFDELGRDPADAKPNRIYEFTEEQLPLHYSKSKLGHSYSIWLPWDPMGGPRHEVSLIVRFSGHGGAVTVGEQTKQVLPGRPPTDAELGRTMPPPAAMAPVEGIRQVGYQAPLPQNPGVFPGNGPPRMLTTTIPVPNEFGCRWPVAQTTPRLISPPGAPAAGIQNSPQAPGLFPPGGPVRGPLPIPPTKAEAIAPGSTPPQDCFAPWRHQVPGEPTVRPTFDHAPTQPYLGVSRFRLEASPADANGTGGGATATGENSVPR
jgi:hypothetical protein